MATSGGGLKPQTLKHSARMVYAHHLLDSLADLKQPNGRQDSASLLESEEMLMYLLDRHAERMGVELMLCLAPSYLPQLTLKPSQGLSVCDITRILHKCCHLSALSLENWEELDVGQVVALTRPQLTSLVTLNVGGCEAVADQHVQDLLRLCVSLRHLTLDLTAITDSAFLLHPSRQHHLELTGQQGRGHGRDRGGGRESGWQCGLNHVSVSGCEHFTNTGLLHLASLCGSALRSLQLHDTQVDFYGLLYLSGHSKLSAKHFLHSLLQAVDTTTDTTADDATATTTLTTSQPGSTDLWRAEGEEEEERAEFPPAVEDHRKGGSIEDREHDNGIQHGEGIHRAEGIGHDEGIQRAEGIQHGQASCQTEQTVDQDTGVSLTYLGKPADSHRSQQNTVVLSSMSQQNNSVTRSSTSKENSVTRSSVSQQNSVTTSSISKENSVTKSSILEENSVTRSSISEKKSVTMSSISEENSVTRSSISEENNVTKSSISEENSVAKSSISHKASVTLPSVSQQTMATWTQSSAESAAVQLTSVHSSSHPALSQFAAAPAAWGLCSPPSRPDHHMLPSSSCFHAGASCSGESQREVADPRQVLLTVADLDSFSVKHQDRQTSGHEDRERPEGKEGQMSDHVDLERSASKESQMSGHMEDLDQVKDSRRSGHKVSEHSGCEDLTRSNDRDCGRSYDKDRNKPVCRSSSGDEKCPCFTDEAASRPEETSLPRPLSPVRYWGPVMKNRKKASCSRTTPSSSPPGLMFRSEVKRVSFSSNLGKVKVKGEGHQLCPLQCFRHFLSANPGLKHLRLQWTLKESEGPLFHEYCQLLVTQVLEAIGEYVPHLQHLAITQEDTGGSYLDDTSVSHLLTRCTHLQSLVISGDSGGLTDKAFDPLQNNSCLEHLSLSPYPITLTTPFFTHPHHPSQLTTLDLTWCEEVQEEQLNQCLILCPFLTTLRLRLCKVSSDTLRVIAQHCTAVRHLDISGGQNLQDEAVVCLAHALHDLTSLDVSNNYGVGDDSVQALMMFCPHLETLCLSCLPLLTSLSFVPMVTGDGWKEWIADQLLPSPLSSRPPYASLHHSEQDVRYQLSQRRSDWHRSSNYGGSLKQVDLSYCNRIDDSSLRAVVTVCRGGVQVTNYYKQLMTPYPPLW